MRVTPIVGDGRAWLSGISRREVTASPIAWIRRPEAIALVVIVVAAGLLRFWDLGGRAAHHDESLHGYYSWFMAGGGGFHHNPLLHGTVQFITTSVAFRVFGASDATLRVLPALLGTIVVALPYVLFRNRMGTWGAITAAGLLAISPGILYFSRFARNDIYIVLITLVLFWTMWAYMDTRRFRYLVIASATLAIGFATKEIMYLIVLVPITFLIIAHISHARRLIRTPLREWPPAAVYGLILVTLVLPMGSAGIALFQNVLGIHLANPEAGVEVSAGALTNLPGPTGAPISQGGGVVLWILEHVPDLPLIGVDLADLRQIQHPEAATLLGIQSLDIAVLALLALFTSGALLGILWSRRHWLIISGVFWLAIVALFTTLFTHWIGLGSGVWQSLGYWVAQQDVGRGGQPWYYYAIILWVYELLPLVVAGVTGFFLVKRRTAFLSFDVFLICWFLLMLLLLLVAGEKMPWLSIHLTLPLIMIAGRGLGEYLPRAANILRELLSKADAHHVGHAVAIGALAVLLVLTVRSSIRSSFENGDVPVEMLVYTQTSPALKQAVGEIHRYAIATGVGTALPITIDSAQGYSWPWHWYLRDYTSVEYRCMGGESTCGEGVPRITEENPPTGRIMALNVASESNIRGGDAAFDSVNKVRIPLRWWFPEEVYRGDDYYEGLDVVDIARGAVDPGVWSTIWTYWMKREPPRRLGSSDIYMYFPKGYSHELQTPPDPVYGPA